MTLKQLSRTTVITAGTICALSSAGVVGFGRAAYKNAVESDHMATSLRDAKTLSEDSLKGIHLKALDCAASTKDVKNCLDVEQKETDIVVAKIQSLWEQYESSHAATKANTLFSVLSSVAAFASGLLTIMGFRSIRRNRGNPSGAPQEGDVMGRTPTG